VDVNALIHGISIWALPVLFAIVLHEVAHGWVADRLGDPTARLAGRLSLNPLKHIDPIGTLVLPLALVVFSSPVVFGYAKPVPVNFSFLHRPKQDMIWVALAGPAMNLLLALLSVLILAVAVHLPAWFAQPLAEMAQASIMINIVLMLFNLLPLPPLDGGRVLTGLLPMHLARHMATIEPYGFFVLLALLFLGWLQPILIPPVSFAVQALMTWAFGLANLIT